MKGGLGRFPCQGEAYDGYGLHSVISVSVSLELGLAT